MSAPPFGAGFLREYTEAMGRAAASLRPVEPEAADRVVELTSPVPRGRPRVVVVGEAKRGKSSLVNALLRSGDLSPVGVLETTATALAFHHAAPSETAALVHLVGGDDPVRVPRDELAGWVTLEGAAGNDRPPVRWADVPCPVGLLEHFSLVDTPGLGGLASSVGRVTLESVEQAAAVVFVGECHSELTSVEIEFLAAAAERVETVLVALGSAGELEAGELDLILAANRERLAGISPRLGDLTLLPVDAVTARRAADDADPVRGEGRWNRSGFARLEQELVAATSGRGWSLAYLNSLRAALTLVAVAGARLEERLAALEDPRREQDLLVERERLARERRTLGRSAKAQLGVAIANERLEVGRHIAQLLLQIEQEHAARIRSGEADVAGLPEQVAADLELVAVQVSERLARVLDRLVADRLGELFADEDLAGVEAQLGARLALSEGTARMLPERDRDVVLTAVSTAGVAFMAGRAGAGALGMLGLASTAMLAPMVAVGLGLGAGAALVRLRAVHGRRADAQSWLARSLPEIRNELTALATARLNEVQSVLGLALDDLLDERIAALDSQLRQIDADRRATQQAPAQLRQQLTALTEACGRLEGAVTRLKVTPASVGARPLVSRTVPTALSTATEGSR